MSLALANDRYKLADLDHSFRFDPERHEYWLNGQTLPSITGILRESKLTGDSRHIPEGSMVRGTDVHLATHFFDEDDLDFSTLEDAWHGYIYGWAEFKHAYKYVPTLSEVPLYHPRMLYRGTVDRDGTADGEPAIAEIKTGELKDWHGYQTAGQEELLMQWDMVPKKRRRLGVRLFADGTFTVKEYVDPLDAVVFRAALVIEQAKRRRK